MYLVLFLVLVIFNHIYVQQLNDKIALFGVGG